MRLPTARKLATALTRRRLAAGALLAVACVVAAVPLLSAGAPHKSAAAGTGVPAGQTTAVVERRTLTESATVEGTLGYGGKLEVYDRLAGTFTWLPAIGAVIRRGDKLYKIDNHPVVLMYGEVPAYRTLKEGISDGPDVAELNRNLIDLGYDPYGEITEAREFTAATAAAVRRWQKAKGLAETGEVELGRVVFAPGARRITSVHVSLGEDPPGAPESEQPSSDAPGSEAPAGEASGGEQPAKAPASEAPTSEAPTSEAPTSEAPTATSHEAERPAKERPKAKRRGAAKHAAKEAPSSAESSPKEPSSEAAASTKSPSGSETGGAGGGGGELTLSTTSTRQLVQLMVKADQQRLARRGEHVPVSLPGERVVKGRITSVGTVASESGETGESGSPGGEGAGGGENATISVTVALEHPVARLDEAPVSVELLQEERRNVLAVPATALSATADGGYEVQTLRGERVVSVAVTPGMFADGYVQVEGAGLHEGMTIIESE